jgi:hypothetical protein
MIEHCSQSIFATDEYEFDVEGTPGGHFIRISSVDGKWSGLYRCDATLILRARCRGEPPGVLTPIREVRELLDKIIAAL